MAEKELRQPKTVEELHALANKCRLCPRKCGVERHGDEKGFCGIGKLPLVASAGPHFGEEPPLVGSGGSGTIFFSGCNIGCVFCQNWDISHGRQGRPVTPARIAEQMLRLQSRGCHNINFVTPTHVTPWIAEAIVAARSAGLEVPIVYNCGGYESVEVLKLLDGLIEIYMPDAKFAGAAEASRYINAPDYPDVMKRALKEMQRQVGGLVIKGSVAVSGLLVRHLVMPNGVAGSKEILDFIAGELSQRTWVNIMDQYYPCYRSEDFPEINRTITRDEYIRVYKYAQSLGLSLL